MFTVFDRLQGMAAVGAPVSYTHLDVYKRQGITGIAEERQKVAFVIRMWLHGGVIMIAGLCKVIGAVALLVDVHGVKSGRIWHIFVWEAKDFRLNENSAIRSIVKFHEAAQIGSGCAASDPGGCLRAVVFKERKKS